MVISWVLRDNEVIYGSLVLVDIINGDFIREIEPTQVFAQVKPLFDDFNAPCQQSPVLKQQ